MRLDYCLYCGGELVLSARRGRIAKFCSGACKVAHHRRQKRYTELCSGVTKLPDLTGLLILELFPGAGLFGRAFEALGAMVVRGNDILYGSDVRTMRGVRGKFDGIIGGAPCQFASRAAIKGTKAVNLIPEFVRLVEECEPGWAVLENVREARPYAPDWDYVFLRDWDCGGLTHRRRGFWFYGVAAPPAPDTRPGTPEYSALASNWNRRGSSRIKGQVFLTADEAARLQGYPDLGRKLFENQPGWKASDGRWKGVSEYSRNVLAVHMLGNGVPNALGKYIAQYIALVKGKEEKIAQRTLNQLVIGSNPIGVK